MKFTIDLFKEWMPTMEKWELDMLINNFTSFKKKSLTKDVVICFIEYVYNGYSPRGNKPIGKRIILAKIIKEQYIETTEHTFNLQVINCIGCQCDKIKNNILRYGRNMYKMILALQLPENYDELKIEKHKRGFMNKIKRNK